MKSIILGLSLASAAAAQYVNGVSMVPYPTAASYDSSSAPSYDGSSYDSSSSVSAAPSVYTPPPVASSSSSNFYDSMPYSSYQSGGYKSLDCGYGYKKSSDGSCQAESWVSRVLYAAYVFDLTNSHSTAPQSPDVMPPSSSSTRICLMIFQSYLSYI